jgi:hypothetical protein
MKGEFDRTFAGSVSPEALIAAARSAGLDSGRLVPRCLAYRRVSEPGATRQLYFVLFDGPVFVRFRQQIASLREAARPHNFDPAALSPVLIIGASVSAFNHLASTSRRSERRLPRAHFDRVIRDVGALAEGTHYANEASSHRLRHRRPCLRRCDVWLASSERCNSTGTDERLIRDARARSTRPS